MYLIRALLDFLLPRYCVICGERLMVDEDVICVMCDLKLPRVTDDSRLIERFYGKIPVERVSSLLYYKRGEPMTELLYAKYHHRGDVSRSMGRRMAKELEKKDFFKDIDALVPVPLSARRIRQRGYNQSEELARGISDILGIPIMKDCLKRNTFTVSQTRLWAMERKENVEGRFVLNPKTMGMLAGKHILIIDDVITTGATTTECGKQLATIPGVKISVLSLAIRKYLH